MASFPIVITRMSGVPRGYEIGKGGHLSPVGEERAAYLRADRERSRDAKKDLCRYISCHLTGYTAEELDSMSVQDVLRVYREQDDIRPEE